MEHVAAAWHELIPEALPRGSRVLLVAQVHLAPEPRHVGVARRWVAERLPDFTEDVRDVVTLLTSELVTNVVVHARTELDLRLTLTERDVLVGVHDLDLGRTELPGPERDGGRGLSLVQGLASAWGHLQHAEGGKTFWFRVSS